jgi:hypothetical protein
VYVLHNGMTIDIIDTDDIRDNCCTEGKPINVKVDMDTRVFHSGYNIVTLESIHNRYDDLIRQFQPGSYKGKLVVICFPEIDREEMG